jgi:hypothetical protein
LSQRGKKAEQSNKYIPALPLSKLHIRTQTYDYYRKRYGHPLCRAGLFACKVIAQATQKHSHRQRLEFLKQTDREITLRQHIQIISGQLLHP